MNQPTRKRHLPAFALSDHALKLFIGYFIASVATVLPGYAASAEPSLLQPAQQPTVKPTPTPDPGKVRVPVAKKLLGQWLTKEPLDGDMVMFVFAPDGNVFIITGTAASGNAIARQFQYRIDDKSRPIHLDIILAANAIVQTLFEFTANDELRLQMLGTRPGKPRLAALTDSATLFQKISDDTTLPPGIELKKPSVPAK